MHAVMSDRTRIAYVIHGDPNSSKRVVLLHSLAMDHTFWNPVAQALSSEAAILTVDCRGHGASDKPGGPYTVEQFADDLAQLMTHIGWESAVVAGASMGGCVSLAFAIRHPARTKGLGLFDTTACYGDNALPAWEERAAKAMSEGLEGLIAFQKTRWFSDGFRERSPQVVQACIDVFLRNELPAYAATCVMLGTADLRPLLHTIKAPARIIVGDEDYATPVAMAEVMHASITGSTLRIVPGARHLSPLEIPDDVVAELRILLG